MSKNPFVNGFTALAYIVLIVSVMNYGTKTMNNSNSFMASIAVISLFTLSAAVMGYLFCYQPIQLYFNGKKKQSAQLFLKTVGVFGFLTVLMMGLLFLKVFS